MTRARRVQWTALALIVLATLILVEVISRLAIRWVVPQVAVFHRSTAAADPPASDYNLHIFANAAPGANHVCYNVKRNVEQIWKTPEFTTRIRTNNRGWRDDRDLAAGESVDIALVGDSFAFGHGVDQGERFIDHLQKSAPTLKVFSYSYENGWTTPHYYLYLRDHPELVPTKLLILSLFPYNDLEADMGQTEFVRDRAGKLLYTLCKERYVSPEGYLTFKRPGESDESRASAVARRILLRSGAIQLALYARHVQSVRSERRPKTTLNSIDAGQPSQTALDALQYVLELRDLAENRGAQFLVLLVPPPYWIIHYQVINHLCPYSVALCQGLVSNHAFQDWFRVWTREHRIDLLDPTDELQARERGGERIYYPGDGHWTPLGHRVIGDLLRKDLERRNWSGIAGSGHSRD